MQGNGRPRAERTPENGKSDRAAHDSRLYAEFSRFYDAVVSRVFIPRVASVIRELKIPPGARVLELGVGTGMSLSAYPAHSRVTGLDLSADMLRQARHKIERMGWTHVDVQVGDATRLPFPDDAFAQYLQPIVLDAHNRGWLAVAARAVVQYEREIAPHGGYDFLRRDGIRLSAAIGTSQHDGPRQHPQNILRHFVCRHPQADCAIGSDHLADPWRQLHGQPFAMLVINDQSNRPGPAAPGEPARERRQVWNEIGSLLGALDGQGERRAAGPPFHLH